MNIDLLNEMILEGYINKQTNGDLTLYNYSRSATYERHWNSATMAARGLILNHVTGEVVAWPLGKFFNWGEADLTTEAPIVSATTKVDGSCGILYRQDGEFKIATRGSFNSDQAIWATEHLNSGGFNLDGIPERMTLVFEIIYPENKIVVDYGDKEGLVLLFGRNRFTGKELTRNELFELGHHAGIEVVEEFSVSTIDDLLALKSKLSVNEEGWVILFDDGQRFKIKGDAYTIMHKLIADFTPKKMGESWIDNRHVEMRKDLPEEFWADFDETIEGLEAAYLETTSVLNSLYSDSPHSGTRKEFAIWIIENVPKSLLGFMFQTLDGKLDEKSLRRMVTTIV